jgi:hypothetical protein
MFEFAGIAGIFQQLGLDFIITMHVFTGNTQLFDRKQKESNSEQDFV